MIDLHIHSCYSDDGEYRPAELVKACAAQNITLFSIADHNCVKANEEAEREARLAGLDYVPGVEIDCLYKKTNLHVLGYGMKYTDEGYAELERNIRRQAAAASMVMLEKTRALGFEIAEEELRALAAGSYWEEKWTGEMFAEVLLKRPEYEGHPMLAPYRPGGTRSDNPYVNFYWDFYGPGKSCHAAMEYPDVRKVLELIHETGGIAVLAHPGASIRGQESIIENLRLDLDGIEVYSSYHTEAAAEVYRKEAEKYRMLLTCGSDFHGKNKPSISLGQYPAVAAEEKKRIQKDFYERIRRSAK